MPCRWWYFCHGHLADRFRFACIFPMSMDSKTEHHGRTPETPCPSHTHSGQRLVVFTRIRDSVDCDHEMIGEKADDLLPFAELDSVLCLNALEITEKLIRYKCSIGGTLL